MSVEPVRAVASQHTAPAGLQTQPASSSSSHPTPLERRTWVQQAQRAVRLAVTGLKSVRLQYNDCAEEGEQRLNTVCNQLLQLLHLPALQLGALTGLTGLREAAALKLTRLLTQQLQLLNDSCSRLQALCQEAQQHAQSLQPLLQEGWQLASADTLQPGLGLSSASRMLQEVAANIAADTRDKLAVVSVLTQHVQANTAGKANVHGAASASAAASGVSAAVRPLPAEEMTQRCQVWLSVWILNPHADISQEEMVLAVLAAAVA